MAAVVLAGAAGAGEISPGISIVPRPLDAPINEQPYFGFAKKTDAQKEADATFVETITVRGGRSREQGGKEVAAAGWQFIFQRGDWATAAKRFNQAWLLDPSRSDIAHGFAIITAERFNNLDYALDLFNTAQKLKGPLPSLPADHGRALLKGGRPAEAIPLLEQAVRQTPDWAVPHSNLANAYLETGQMQRACEALAKVPSTNNANVRQDMARVRERAGCP